jgi:predicted flap endonuclease-1-like 5' DNA nuclease/prefoldin subunit 5
MSSFIWLLLYLAPLLGLTAALFAWFGWQWRGSDMQQRIDALNAQIEKAQAALRQAEAAHAPPTEAAPAPPDPAATAEAQALRDELKSAQAETRLRQDEAAKAHEAAQALEAEVARLIADMEGLRDELQPAQAEARLRQDEAAKAHEAAQALEAEVARVTAEMEELRAAHFAAQAELDHLRNAPAVAPPPAAEEAAAVVPDKPKRKRSTPAKPKAGADAPTTTLRDKISALETQLSAHRTGLETLTQERDDWQRRIRKLEGQTLADPAGMALAHRSLAGSEKRLATATSEIERLQNQTRVLLRVEEKTAALADVPDDDLTQIKGIKSIISEQLHAHGIRTWRQIAQWDEDELRVFSELLAFKNRATREQWQQQARTLHEAAHGPLT